MKTIGLIGGMSWESTVTYYQVINEVIKQELGGLHSAKCLLYSVEFDEIEKCQSSGDWEKSAALLSDVAKRLELAGADFIVICTNTMHKVAPQIADAIHIPILHIGEATADALKQNQVKKIALLGTKYTMTQDFMKEKIREAGIEVVLPNEEEINLINDIIFNELCVGIIKEESKKAMLKVMERLYSQGAEGAILGCTEIGGLIHQEDTKIPLYDTTILHATKAAIKALEA